MIQEKFFFVDDTREKKREYFYGRILHTKFVRDFGVLDQGLWYSFCKYWNFSTDFNFSTLWGAYIILS